MINKIILFLLMIASPFILEAQINAKTTIRNKKNVTIVFSMLSDSIENLKNERIIDYCSEYILKYYPELSFPLHITIEPIQIENYSYEIMYNNYFKIAFNISKEELLEIEKEDSPIDKLGIKIYSDRSIINLFKLIDYGIKNERKIRNKFWKIRNKDNSEISIKDIESLVIEGEKINNILSKPLSKSAAKYMKDFPFQVN